MTQKKKINKNGLVNIEAKQKNKIPDELQIRAFEKSRTEDSSRLLDLLEFWHNDPRNGCNFALTQGQIVEYLGISQPTVCRVMKKLFSLIDGDSQKNGMKSYYMYCRKGNIREMIVRLKILKSTNSFFCGLPNSKVNDIINYAQTNI